jgi:hypothetical protein
MRGPIRQAGPRRLTFGWLGRCRPNPERRFSPPRELSNAWCPKTVQISTLLRSAPSALQQDGRIREEGLGKSRLSERPPHRAADKPPELSPPECIRGRSL